MMKTTLFLIASILLTVIALPSHCQQPDYSLARAGKRIHGVYIFIRTEPYHEYDYIESVKVKINWTGTAEESFEKAIEKAKKKHPYFNGMIFQSSDFGKADLIRFKDLKVSRSGFTIRSKVSFILKDVAYFGEIIELESSKDKASVQFLNLFNEPEIVEMEYTELVPLSDEEFQSKKNEFISDIQNISLRSGKK